MALVKRFTELTYIFDAIGGSNPLADSDVWCATDISDTTDHSSGTSKRVTSALLYEYMFNKLTSFSSTEKGVVPASGGSTGTKFLSDLGTFITVPNSVATDLSAHIADTTTHGVTGAIVGISDTQTLTNKTIVAASNTITTAASGNLTSTELNNALAELQTDIDTRIAVNANITIENATPYLRLIDTNASGGVDEKKLNISLSDGALVFQYLNDADAGGGDYVKWGRSSNAMTGLTFYDNGNERILLANSGVATFYNSNAAGLILEDHSDSSSAPWAQFKGKRSDGNTMQSFGGKLSLASYRTDDAIPNNKMLGSIFFGGNHTDGTESNISHAASISGIAEGAFTDVNTMPTGIAFLTGAVGRALNQASNNIGTERMRITNDGKVGIGVVAPTYNLEVVGTFHADSINVNAAYTLPTVDGDAANKVMETNSSGTAAWAYAKSFSRSYKNTADIDIHTSAKTLVLNQQNEAGTAMYATETGSFNVEATLTIKVNFATLDAGGTAAIGSDTFKVFLAIDNTTIDVTTATELDSSVRQVTISPATYSAGGTSTISPVKTGGDSVVYVTVALSALKVDMATDDIILVGIQRLTSINTWLTGAMEVEEDMCALKVTKTLHKDESFEQSE